ncbi:MAG: PepSY domain-containing protein [Acidimicrobiales bacterium]
MQRRSRIIIGIAALAGATAIGTAGVALAGGVGGDDRNERPINAAAIQQAEAAALDHTGGGRVTGTEEGDEESLYEVEVTRADGSAVDVQLDKDFKVVGDKVDDDTTEGS